jgi:hypothetical protein
MSPEVVATTLLPSGQAFFSTHLDFINTISYNVFGSFPFNSVQFKK